MKRYLLDTGIASDYINRRTRVYDRATGLAKTGARIGVCTPVVGELFSGVKVSTQHLESALASRIETNTFRRIGRPSTLKWMVKFTNSTSQQDSGTSARSFVIEVD